MDVAQIRALKPRLDNYLARFEDCFARCDTATIRGGWQQAR
jgi:hypothetical protein